MTAPSDEGYTEPRHGFNMDSALRAEQIGGGFMPAAFSEELIFALSTIGTVTIPAHQLNVNGLVIEVPAQEQWVQGVVLMQIPQLGRLLAVLERFCTHAAAIDPDRWGEAYYQGREDAKKLPLEGIWLDPAEAEKLTPEMFTEQDGTTP